MELDLSLGDMELDLSLGDLSKDGNSKRQNASINNNKDDGLVFCMALGLNSSIGNQESHKPHQTYDHNDDDDDNDHPLHQMSQDRDRTDDHQEKFMGTAHLQLDPLLLSAVPLHTCGPLLPAVAWPNSVKLRERSASRSPRQLGLVLQLAVEAGGAAEEVVLSANNVVEAEIASSKASTDDDENGHNSRKKLRLSKQQSAYLEKNFREHSTLNPKQKLALANQLNLRPRQVEVWYQNRRARNKLKQTEVDCENLKRLCDILTESNIRLQKEIQELRALNSSNPLYMQLSAMCPSCEQVATTSTTSHPHN